MTADLGTAAFAVGAGVSAFFAPCSYALLPGYVGYYVSSTGTDSVPIGGSLLRGVAAAGGALAAFAGLSAIAIVAGSTLERLLPIVEPLIGLGLIALGVHLLWNGWGSLHVPLPARRSTVLGFGLFGAVYAVAATACVLPLFLALALRSVSMGPVEAAGILGAYAGSFAVLMIAVTVAVAVGHDLGLARIGRYTDRLLTLGSGLLILAGVIQIIVSL